MILAFDTYYYGNKAKTVCIAFDNWESNTIINTYSEIIENNNEYISGEFYKKELPCILSLLDKIKIDDIDVIIIDGYVNLNDDGKIGLGGHLYKVLNSKIPIIGVAKTNYALIKKDKREVLRGDSKKPLYITSVGIELDKAETLIQSMYGEFRIPTILKELDRQTKEV